MYKNVFPFSAIIGQDQLKTALLLNAVNPRIGGVLIRGEKGTAKSTAVRALAALLPKIRKIEGCPFNCSPEATFQDCPVCQNGHRKNIVEKRRQVVTLPLNATEDRVIGGIDFNQAVKSGVRVLQPGLLAKVHRGLLYVDEVNLLDDHIVDLILDAAAMGENRVEREGISFRHPSEFILVGTMNPEEGELRPQLLDRFGLCVDITAEEAVEARIELMRRREEYDADPHEFCENYQNQNENIAHQIEEAVTLLPMVKLPAHVRMFISELCTENHVAGHRADLVMEHAAKALAAYRLRREATHDDVVEIAFMVLNHRRRDPLPPPPPPPPEPEEPDEPESPPEEDSVEDPPENDEDMPEQEQPPLFPEMEDMPQEMQPENREDEKDQNRKKDPLEQIFEIGETFKVKRISTPKDRIFRRGSGRRSRTRISQKQGRYIKSTMNRGRGDIALDATLRAAAPHQLSRRHDKKLAVYLKNEDIREKIREKRIGNFLLFIVDASGSMGARGRMVASKGAVMSLLLDAYQKRDKVSMVSFRKNDATVNLPPTSSIELAGKLLKEMPVGGRTPLSSGLIKGYEIVRNVLLREPTARPIVIVITDGKANMSTKNGKPVDEAMDFARKWGVDERIRFIVVDTEDSGLVSFGLAERLSGYLNAAYFKIDDLKTDQLIDIVRSNQNRQYQ